MELQEFIQSFREAFGQDAQMPLIDADGKPIITR